MKKLLPILIIVVIIGLAGFMYFQYNSKKSTNSKPLTQQSQNTKQEKNSESYTFEALKAAVELGIPLKCSYSAGDADFEGYLKGKQWRGKIKTQEGKIGEIILKDECIWTWEEGSQQGTKMCFDTEGTEDSIWDMDENTGDSSMEYNCKPAVITDATFELPKDINFVDFDELTNSYMEEE